MRLFRSLWIVPVCLGLCLAACQSDKQATPSAPRQTASKVAAAYAVAKFDQIDALRFTFNVQLESKQIRRSWIWQPVRDEVSYTGPDPNGQPLTLTYRRAEATQKATAGGLQQIVDSWFINDQYWLLFPLHLAWDADLKLEQRLAQPLPLGGGFADMLQVSYPSVGGYTPGDIYELYLGDDLRIAQWVYRKAGASAPTRIARWEDHRRVGPLLIALEHRGPDERFHLWFTDVAVKVKGRDGWQAARVAD